VLGNVPAGYTYSVITTVPGQVDLVVVNVPEPSTWMLMPGGATVLLAFSGMRRRFC
jgi:PEP-CTERM motif